MIYVITEAEMIVKLYVRGCTNVWKTDPNGCKDFSELTLDEQGELIRQLQPLQRLWRHSTFFGTVCTIWAYPDKVGWKPDFSCTLYVQNICAILHIENKIFHWKENHMTSWLLLYECKYQGSTINERQKNALSSI